MKYLFFFIFLLIHAFSYGQFAVIADNQGHVNVREDGTINSTITDSLKNGHLVFVFEQKGNWTNIDYSKKNEDLNGYIYKDRYKLILDYLKIPIVAQGKNSVTFRKDSIEITVTKSSFEKNKHQYKYFKDAADQVELIDNKTYWGTDGGIPGNQYQKIIIRLGQKVIVLPKKTIENLFNPNLDYTRVNFDKEKNIIYIQSMNSDGAGSYHVIWKVENGIYKERYIALGF